MRLPFYHAKGQLTIHDNDIINTLEFPIVSTRSTTSGEYSRSVDGRVAFVLWLDDQELYVWNGTTVTRVGVTDYNSNPTWSADGRLAFASGGDLYLWDNGTIMQVTHTPNIDETNPVWMP
jgi:hypothetical protein